MAAKVRNDPENDICTSFGNSDKQHINKRQRAGMMEFFMESMFAGLVAWSVNRALSHSLLHVRVEGRENIPERGPAILVANHVSFLDAFLIGACVRVPVRFLVWNRYYHSKIFHWGLRLGRAIPLGDRIADLAPAIRSARAALRQGDVLGVFAEGAISRTGNLLPFKRGVEVVAKGLRVPVIPVHLHGLWGSIFSFAGGRFIWKRPRRLRRRVIVSFGRPMLSATSGELRRAVQELSAEAAILAKSPNDTLAKHFVRSARRHWGRPAVGDAGGSRTYGEVLSDALVMAKWLRRNAAANRNAGILLPPSPISVVANIAVISAGKVAVNLDPEKFASIVEQCGIAIVLTSRDYLAAIRAAPPKGSLFVEDILKGASPALLPVRARFAPLRALLDGAGDCSPDSPAAIVFSHRGGVLLSHHNIVSNVGAFAQVFHRDGGGLEGVLPYSDPFGYTLSLWLPLLTGRTVDSAKPLQAFECYGCAEMAGVVAANVPDFAGAEETQLGSKPGTAGHPLPGIAVQAVTPDGFQPLPPNREGLLLVKGPSRMLGYLGLPELTAVAMRDGWYVTGDYGAVDEDGFLRVAKREFDSVSL